MHSCSVFLTLNPGSRFQENWHLEALAYHLEQVRRGETRRLMINLPPRHLKSLTASVALPAFLLGHDPTLRAIVASYGSELAVKLANDFRTILNSLWYKAIFPGTRISRMKNTEYEVVTTRGGFRLATSVDGTLTGRGGDIIIIDDPLKPSDALSDSKRGHVNEWFRNTVLSRLDDKVNGAIIILMQRLHVDDLCGCLLKGSDEWTQLKIPAIAQVDEEIQIGARAIILARPEICYIEKESRSRSSNSNFAVRLARTISRRSICRNRLRRAATWSSEIGCADTRLPRRALLQLTCCSPGTRPANREERTIGRCARLGWWPIGSIICWICCGDASIIQHLKIEQSRTQICTSRRRS